jgi:CheY-like chemotaxis protein
MALSEILLADDDAAIRTVVAQALSRAGYEERTAGTAATLWRWVQSGESDLVVTDVVMPDENAFEQPELGLILRMFCRRRAQPPKICAAFLALPDRTEPGEPRDWGGDENSFPFAPCRVLSASSSELVQGRPIFC